MRVTIIVDNGMSEHTKYFEYKGFSTEQMLQPLFDVYTEMIVFATCEMHKAGKVGMVKGRLCLE
jgi:hypothetical protein